jgi:hypothetical protein
LTREQEPEVALKAATELRTSAEKARDASGELRRTTRDPLVLRNQAEALRRLADEVPRVRDILMNAQDQLLNRVKDPNIQDNRREIERLKAEADKLIPEEGLLSDTRDALFQEIDALYTRASELQILLDARAIDEPAERTLAFDRVARALLSGNNTDADFRGEDALEAIRLGRESALRISDPTIRDVRIDNLAETAIALGQTLQLAALAPRMRDPLQAGGGLTSQRQLDYLRQARQGFELASDLASHIGMLDFQCNRKSLVAEYLARLSAAAANASRDSTGGTPNPSVEPVDLLPGEDFPNPSGNPADSRGTRATPRSPLLQQADSFLLFAFETAQHIPYPLWRNRTLVTLVTAAAQSGQFERGREIALAGGLPRHRVESLVLLAEAQIKFGKPEDATLTYQEALNNALAVDQPSMREVFGLILFDSLLNQRRFADARAVTTIVRTPELRINALSLLATAMGESGLDQSAYQWIDQSIAEPELRDRLRRRVVDGYSRYVQDRRTKGTEVVPYRPSSGGPLLRNPNPS